MEGLIYGLYYLWHIFMHLYIGSVNKTKWHSHKKVLLKKYKDMFDYLITIP